MISAASFGIPTIAARKSGYKEWAGNYIPVNNINSLVAEVEKMKEKDYYDKFSRKIIEAAEPYHIANIAKLYRQLNHNWMKDITIIYLTASLIPESFAKYQRHVLLEAIENSPLISVSRKPLNFGINILDDKEKSESNIYYQMLRAARLAKTDYIAIAEDDTLYPKEHFSAYRPEQNTFAYNFNRLALFTWSTPMYSWFQRASNCALIAPRKLAVEALSERFKKYPNGTPSGLTGELGRAERYLKLPKRNVEEFYTDTSIIQFNHDFATEAYQRLHKKRWGSLRSFDIPYWGKAADLVSHFK